MLKRCSNHSRFSVLYFLCAYRLFLRLRICREQTLCATHVLMRWLKLRICVTLQSVKDYWVNVLRKSVCSETGFIL